MQSAIFAGAAASITYLNINESAEGEGGYSFEDAMPGMAPEGSGSYGEQGAETNDEDEVERDGGKAKLKALSGNYIKRTLKAFETDPHSFKREYAGSANVSRFDIKAVPDGEFWLEGKSGAIQIPTGIYPWGQSQ